MITRPFASRMRARLRLVCTFAAVSVAAMATPNLAVAEYAWIRLTQVPPNPYSGYTYPVVAEFYGREGADFCESFCYFYDDRVDPNTFSLTINGAWRSMTVTETNYYCAGYDMWGNYACHWYYRATGEPAVYFPNTTNTLRAQVDTWALSAWVTISDAYQYYTPQAYGLTVTASATMVTVRPRSANIASFLVANTGNYLEKFVLAPSCTAAAAHGGCIASSDTMQLASGGNASVDVHYAAESTPGSTGAVSLQVTRVGGAETATGTTSVTVQVSSTPALVVDTMNAGETVERDLCLTISLGPAAASECGDLRVVHGLPSVQTMNKARAPTLLYNSQHAHPAPVVAALVTPPSGSPLPATVEMQILIDGAAQTLVGGTGTNGTVVSWPGGQWEAAGNSRRIAAVFDASSRATGVYAATVEVTLVSSGGTRTPYTAPITIPVVNRQPSPFGAGWWLAGMEQFDPATKVWVGGDGSVRQYRATGNPSKWVATALDRPDTIAQVSGYYVRYLPDSLKVKFDASGRHVQTVNRLGHVTTFHYNANGWLDTLTVPTPGNGGGARDPNDSTGFTGSPAIRRYTIDYYGPSTAQVDSVRIDAPGVDGPGSYRRTTLRLDPPTRDLLRIKDADGSEVTFQYTPSAGGHRITGRTDRRGTPATYTYDASARLVFVSRGIAPDTSNLRLAPAESRGVVTTAFPQAHALADYRTTIDGPRSQATGDTTSVWINRFGAPVKTMNALGYVWLIEYGDARWPALATRMQAPNGRVTIAGYDARGLLTFRSDLAVGPSGENSTTRYKWDVATENVTNVRAPSAASTRFAYAGATGNRLWEQPGDLVARRVVYTYYSNGLPRGVQLPGTLEARMAHDNLGNQAEVRSARNIPRYVERDSLGRAVVARQPVDLPTTAWTHDSSSYDISDRVMRGVVYAQAFNGVAAQKRVVRNFYGLEGQTDSVFRYNSPDTTATDTLKLKWRYDVLGRTRQALDGDSKVDTSWYDPAGNLTRVITRRGDTLTTDYDALNRVTKRRTSATRYAARLEGIPVNGSPALREFNMPYPRYSSEADSSLFIPADSSEFEYDLMGNMIRADNSYAQVRRRYDIRGLLIHDTLRIRTLAPGDFTTHGYVLTNTYDLDGRRIALSHPTQLRGPYQQSRWSYDPADGSLATVTDLMGNVFRYHHNVQSDIDSLYMPDGWADGFEFDYDGNVTRHTTRTASSDWRDEIRTYDATGRVGRTMNGKGLRDTLDATYAALGWLRTTKHYANQYNASNHRIRTVTEGWFYNDVVGNLTSNSDRRSQSDVTAGITLSDVYRGRGQRYQIKTGRHVRTDLHDFWSNLTQVDVFRYDGSGNLDFTTTTGTSSHWGRFDRASYYAADGTLYATDTRSIDDVSYRTAYRSTFEEYRYDALRRRVWTRSRRFCENVANAFQHAECNIGTMRRTVWDGSAELYEIQVPGDNNRPATELENDTTAVHEPLFSEVFQKFDPNPYFGRVAYSYGVAIDKPLSLVRFNYADAPYNVQSPSTDTWTKWNPVAIVPFWNGRGQADNFFFTSSGAPRCISANRCVIADVVAYYQAYGDRALIPPSFHGTLINDKRDHSGNYYRRNRTYDPGTGRFTQEDPIGLAGGLNLYGYAFGDPVNFSDPFGLCPPIDQCSAEQRFAILAGTGRMVSPLNTAAEAVGKAGLELSGVNDLERAAADGNVLGGAVALASMLPVGRAGAGLVKGIAKTIDRAQGAKVSFDRLGKFTRATWQVAGDKGAGHVRWNRVLNEEGSTIRLYKDVYGQGGDFLRRDWYVGGPPK